MSRLLGKGIPEYVDEIGVDRPKKFNCSQCGSRYRNSKRYAVISEIMADFRRDVHQNGIISLGAGYLVTGIFLSILYVVRALITFNRRHILLERKLRKRLPKRSAKPSFSDRSRWHPTLLGNVTMIRVSYLTYMVVYGMIEAGYKTNALDALAEDAVLFRGN